MARRVLRPFDKERTRVCEGGSIYLGPPQEGGIIAMALGIWEKPIGPAAQESRATQDLNVQVGDLHYVTCSCSRRMQLLAGGPLKPSFVSSPKTSAFAWAGIFAGITGRAKVRDKLRPCQADGDALILDRAKHRQQSSHGAPVDYCYGDELPGPRHCWPGHPAVRTKAHRPDTAFPSGYILAPVRFRYSPKTFRYRSLRLL